MPTTHDMGVDNTDSAFSTEDAADALLNSWIDAGKLSNPDGGAKPKVKKATPSADLEDTEEDEETNETEDTEDVEDAEETEDQGEESESDDEDTEESEAVEAGDDAVVKITVDGESRTVSVKDLKRLYGQEASLTRKSQEVAATRKQAEEEGAKYTVALQKLQEKAQARFKPYADIDWLVAQNQLDASDFAALRAEARAAYEDVQFLQTEADTTLKQAQETRAREAREAAKKAIEVLEKDIPDWSQKTYDAIRSYAITQGIEESDINQVVDPAVIKLIHKAMQFDTASTKLVETKKKVSAAKRVLKSKTKAAEVMGKKTESDAMKRFKTSGSTDDAVEALLAKWANDSDD